MASLEYETAPEQDEKRLKEQLALALDVETRHKPIQFITLREKLVELLSEDLDFQGDYGFHSAHKIHSFPARFPPQLPQKFIHGLSQPGEVVLDPMMGSGTTLLEAALAKRKGLGFDIDPLAALISRVKTTPLHKQRVLKQIDRVVGNARKASIDESAALEKQLESQWDDQTREFAEYWFLPRTRVELQALKNQIAEIQFSEDRDFLELALSAIIVTKSSGVSMALDLAHTRPHRAKIVLDANGNSLIAANGHGEPTPRHQKLSKTIRSAIDEFKKRAIQNVRLALDYDLDEVFASAVYGDSQAMPLMPDSVDLIVTSPPYAANAIDYMRAHKFTLIWLGHSVTHLSGVRRDYIGSDYHAGFALQKISGRPAQIIDEISRLDLRKGLSLSRYYSEMRLVLGEMHRVLKPGKCAILVVGSSVMRGRDTETGECLAELARQAGFECPKIGARNIDRDRRMLPAQIQPAASQIQQRMHQESVIGLYKPEKFT